MHPDVPLLESEAVCVGTSYYHPDCLRAKSDILEIIDIFSKRLNPNVVYATLQRVLKELIFVRKFDSTKLLWGINWCLDHGWNLRYPQGLYKVAQDMHWQEEYDKINRRKQPKAKMEIAGDMDDTPTFGYKPEKQKSLADILNS